MRGYAGLALWEPKLLPNLGTAFRLAQNFGTAFVLTVGARYHRQPSDTTAATRHIPYFSLPVGADLQAWLPADVRLVVVEVNGDTCLESFCHPERAVYLFGGEDRTVPVPMGDCSVRIQSQYCLSLPSAIAITLWHRQIQASSGQREGQA